MQKHHQLLAPERWFKGDGTDCIIFKILHQYILPELETKENPLKHLQSAHKIGLGLQK